MDVKLCRFTFNKVLPALNTKNLRYFSKLFASICCKSCNNAIFRSPKCVPAAFGSASFGGAIDFRRVYIVFSVPFFGRCLTDRANVIPSFVQCRDKNKLAVVSWYRRQNSAFASLSCSPATRILTSGEAVTTIILDLEVFAQTFSTHFCRATVVWSIMKLLVHNMLQCNIKGVENRYPFKIEAFKVEEQKVDFNPGKALSKWKKWVKAKGRHGRPLCFCFGCMQRQPSISWEGGCSDTSATEEATPFHPTVDILENLGRCLRYEFSTLHLTMWQLSALIASKLTTSLKNIPMSPVWFNALTNLKPNSSCLNQLRNTTEKHSILKWGN